MPNSGYARYVALGDSQTEGLGDDGTAELRWAGFFLGPWLVRRRRGRSSGDGRRAKRPTLLPVTQVTDDLS